MEYKYMHIDCIIVFNIIYDEDFIDPNYLQEHS